MERNQHVPNVDDSTVTLEPSELKTDDSKAEGDSAYENEKTYRANTRDKHHSENKKDPENRDELESKDELQEPLEDYLYITHLPLDLLVELSLFLDIYSFQKASFVNKLNNQILQQDAFWKPRFMRNPSISNDLFNKEWGFKRLYLESPRIRYDGVYISRISYSKYLVNTSNVQIEPSHQQVRPVSYIQVVYYRYLLFLPYINYVLVLRSDADPTLAIQVLKVVENELWEKHNNQSIIHYDPSSYIGRTEKHLKISSYVVIGEYSLCNTTKEITITYEEPCFTSMAYINNVKLHLNVPKKKNSSSSLSWKELCISPRHHNTDISETRVNTKSAHYESFHFKRIKAYDHLG